MKKETKKVVGKRKSQPKIYKKEDLSYPKSIENGTELWQMAARRVGRPYKFEDGETFFLACCEYFEWCRLNPIIEIDYKGKDATPVEMSKPRPLNVRDLCVYLGINEDYLNQLKTTLQKRLDEDENDNEAREFSSHLTRVYDICYSQKLNLAIVGCYKDAIVSKLSGLTEKQENIVNMQGTPQIIMIDDSGNKIEIE